MKTQIALFCLFALCIFLLWRSFHGHTPERLQYIDSHGRSTRSSDALEAEGIVNFKYTGTDGIPYYFSMSDTVPGFPFSLPHLLLSQGDPSHLHSVIALDNNSRTNDDSLNAVIGVVDNSGKINNVLRATPYHIGIQTTLAGDTAGGAYYEFTRDGIILKRGEERNYGLTFFLSNHKGLPGQVLTLNKTGDTASWQNAPGASSVSYQYFIPTAGQEVAVSKSSYNIINPSTSLSSLVISLPSPAEDNDWFEITFTQPVKSIAYKKGKAANNAIKTASLNNNYKKFVFRRQDMTWY